MIVIPVLLGPRGLDKAFSYINRIGINKVSIAQDNREYIPRSRILYERKLALPVKLWKQRASKALPFVAKEIKMRQGKKYEPRDDERVEEIAEAI